ncbi:MAG: hypothetical protein ABJ308_10425 [Halieaceae bacterium]
MTRHPFIRSFFAMILLVLVVQAAVIAVYAVKPQLFYFRAWEYFFRWSNTTQADDSVWDGTELSDLGRRYFFYYQEKRDTHASTDADGFRSVPPGQGAPRIYVHGRSNVFGSGVSDSQTLPWQIAELSGVATFNGAHSNPLATLSRESLSEVKLVVDVFHERHLANIKVTRRVYQLKQGKLLPYTPIAKNRLSLFQAFYRPILRPSYWLPDLVQRWHQRLMLDLKEYRLWGHRPFLLIDYRADNTPISEIADILDQRRAVIEAQGYSYIAAIIPSRQTIYARKKVPQDTLQRGVRVAQELISRGFPLVQLHPDFKARGGPELYYVYDTHWNPRGTELAAELIVAEIGRRYPELLETQPVQQASQ